MNVWQICQVIQNRLRSATWPGSSNVVFDNDSVRIIPQGDEIESLDEGLVPPLCMIMPLSGDMDPQFREEPGYVRRTIDITLVTVNQNDRIGEAPIMGAARADQTSSPGRGLLELEEQVFATIKQLGVEDGIVIQFAGYGEGVVRRDAGNNYIGIQDYTFVVYCSTEAEYPGVDLFTVVGGTAEAILQWRYPIVLPDTYRAVIRYAAGSAPPATISAGSSGGSITGWTSLELASVSVSPLAPGTYSFAVFITYCDPDFTPQTDQHVSPAVTGTVIVS